MNMKQKNNDVMHFSPYQDNETVLCNDHNWEQCTDIPQWVTCESCKSRLKKAVEHG